MCKGRILVVDDELNICRTLSMILQSHGYQVFCALSGEEALEVLRSNEIDLVTTDYFMSGMNGLELCRLIRHEFENFIKIFLCSASELPVEDTACFCCIVPKPFDVEDILNAISLALGA